jgi:DNA-binding GntR family transcriptional regulator
MRTDAGVPGRRANAQDSTYRWLKTHIAGLPRAEGTFLTEGEVATAAGTSRTPVREALLRLEAEGLVQIVPKKGAFVPPVSDRDISDVMEARSVVEEWSVERIATSHRSLNPELNALVAELAMFVTEQEVAIDDAVTFIDLDRAFHRTIVRAAGNMVVENFYESLRDRQLRMGLRAVASAEGRAKRVLTEHRAIVRALGNRDAERATRAVRAHLDNTLGVLRHSSFRRVKGVGR